MNKILINFQIKFIKLLFYISNKLLIMLRRLLWIRKKPIKHNKICIYKTGNIGDIVCAVPTIQMIRKAYPNSHLTFLTSPGKRGMPGGLEVLDGADWLNETIVYYSDEVNTFEKTLQWILELKKKNFDVWIELPKQLASFQLLLRNMIVARIICSHWGYGWRINSLKIFSQVQSEHYKFPNEVSRNLKLISDTGINIEHLNTCLPIKESHRQTIDNIIESNHLKEKPLVAIAPGAKRPINQWPGERFAQIGKYLENLGYFPVFLASKDDYNLCQKINQEMGGGGLNLSGKLTILETAEILTRCRLLVCNDSGVQHISSAVRTPCISLFSYRDIKGKWRPEGKDNIVIQKWIDCHSCLLELCPHDNKCIKLIEVNDVIDAVDQFFSKDSEVLSEK